MKKIQIEPDHFIQAGLKLGQAYLSNGGNVAKLENCLTLAGQKQGLKTSVHATPTSITISCVNDEGRDSKSLSTRLKPVGPHMIRLAFAERLLDLYSGGVLSTRRLLFLTTKNSCESDYPNWLIWISIFLIGSTTSFNRTLNLKYSLIGGLMTILSYSFGKLMDRFLHMNDTAKDFTLCFFGISVSIVLASQLRLHPSHLFIGTLALVLPGLLLTSAVGDLIEENYQTGLIKLAKTVLTLLSMGFAYILSAEWLSSMGFTISALIIEKPSSLPQFLTSFASAISMILSFCFIIKVPRKSILACLIVGVCGWSTISIIPASAHPFAGPFVSALIISVLARAFSHLQNLTLQVYIIPGLLVLTPGLLAFSYLQPLLDVKATGFAARSVLTSVMIAAALSFGLMLGQIKQASNSQKQ